MIMGKIDEKKKLKQEALLYAAFELFTEQGIHNTSISDIVKRAKWQRGLFICILRINMISGTV